MCLSGFASSRRTLTTGLASDIRLASERVFCILSVVVHYTKFT